jgi:hypothetical protein
MPRPFQDDPKPEPPPLEVDEPLSGDETEIAERGLAKGETEIK